MIVYLTMLLLGWKRTPERFVPRFTEYIHMRLNRRGVLMDGRSSQSCLLSLSQLAYSRAMQLQKGKQPRFRHYVAEVDKVIEAVCEAMAGRSIADSRVQDVLRFYGLSP